MREWVSGVLVALLAAGAGLPVVQSAPLVAVWYRGGPGGEPRLDDLAAIRAVGFDAIVWPEERAATLPRVKALAQTVDLAVETRTRAAYATAASASRPAHHIDIDASADARVIAPLAWRAIGRGARSLAFDARASAGTGLGGPDGAEAAWVRPALAIARHLSANATLVSRMRVTPGVRVEPRVDALDVVLLDGDRAWVIVATNTSASPIRATATFPKDVPYGLWASWLDESAMSMLGLPEGPRWTLELEPYGVRVYLIDKVQKQLF